MFTAKELSERSPGMQLYKHVIRSQSLQKYLSYEASFFSEHWKFNIDSKNERKMFKKFDCFSDNLIWIGNCKLSLLLREYS